MAQDTVLGLWSQSQGASRHALGDTDMHEGSFEGRKHWYEHGSLETVPSEHRACGHRVGRASSALS